jgi:alpha-glucosidase (family GH31 glycosyl hydrolase)
VREGAIVPEQPASEYSDAKPLDRLVLNVYGSGNGSFELYEDDGVSLDYEQQHALTTFAHSSGNDGLQRLVIDPTQGTYPAQPQARSYELRIHTDARPSSVLVNGRDTRTWTWDAHQAVAVVALPSESIHDRIVIEWR